ncbi:acyl-CoA dehydrogenase family protein [Gordonia rubripertincta]|uniref:Acyl-CoA dehydrogenase family protein n=1 Tax=Gordonia rubripertincta TaxID=36822 RepID=A0AAW4G4A5_GORRU|nr:acyl-CoA dehydrogenase family protein [Gordonia rubripertincta]ASR01647.1 Acyl-CoA dehydrogenase [Gordonia rubripertincta]MBM7277933.1 acyl-CoA dehydrogenase family protein [Gordonia rubripertincta]QMU22608.1 acyl-CoA dehydrogenase family protein [Gordonia rubripertincta]TSD96465.1 acyl-CoA dehydrogenase [Gordonia rubripertincta]
MTDDQLATVRPESLAALRAEVREFLRTGIDTGAFTPDVDSWMTGFDPEFSRRLGDHGWLGMTMPTEYGGRGRTPVERFVITEELLAHGAPVAAHWIADRQMAPGILANGTEEQRCRYIPGISAGTTFFAIGMSEPDAGSDLASVRTRATDNGNSWTISGTKVWTTGAHIAHAMVLLARTDGTTANRQQGLSQFVVDLPHQDIEIRPIRSIDGHSHFNEVIFHDAVVDSSALLGRRGHGWQQVMSELAFERSGPERYLSTLPLLRSWADHLREHGSTEGQRVTLGSLTAQAWALRRMSLQVARELSAGGEPDVLAAMVKDLGSTFEGDLVTAVRDASGIVPRRTGGTHLERLLAQSVLHTPAFTLRGGTNEILRGIVARGLGIR